MHKFLANSLFIGKPIVNVPICHSTNDMASEMWSQKKASEGMVVVTQNQTKGRGQRGNSWESEPGKNLTFSILFTPGFLTPKEQFSLHYMISLGISDYLDEKLKEPVKIKWPNDIYIGDKKLGGILIENTIRGGKIEASVAGIGLNINQEKFIESKAISMFQITGYPVDLEESLESLLLKIERRYLMLRSGKTNELKNEYHEKLYRRGVAHKFRSRDGQIFEGIILETDEIGRLKVECNQHVNTYDFKEIEFLS